MKRQKKDLRIIYESDNLLAIDKPADIVVYPTKKNSQKSLIEKLLKKIPFLKRVGEPPRYGIIHRLDKDTSGILLIAKNNRTLKLLQEEFKEKRVEKKYLGLVVGNLKLKKSTIETLIGRGLKNRKKQKAYSLLEPRAKKEGLRKAKTVYQVLKKFFDGKNYYCLLELRPETGRKHQLRTHLSYVHHPIAGDRLYKFKKQPIPKGLSRHFLHANYLKIKLPDGKQKEFKSNLPEDLKNVIKNLKEVEE